MDGVQIYLSPLKSVKNNAILFKLLKNELKLLNFLVDSFRVFNESKLFP